MQFLLMGSIVGGYKQKKESNFKRSLTLFWVAGGTRTHDIQNHNLTL